MVKKTPRKENFIEKSIFANILAAGALFFTIISFIYQNNKIDVQNQKADIQNQKIEGLSYKISALQFQPVLKVVGQPSVEKLSLSASIPKKMLFDSGPDSASGEPPILSLRGNVSISTKLKTFNDGNSLARIIGYFVCDTLSDQEVIRDMLLSSKIGEKALIGEPFPDYSQKDIHSKDSTNLFIEHKIKFLKSAKFTLHYLILYENQLGILYDTYFWALYEIQPVDFRREFKLQGKQLLTRLVPETQHIEQAVICRNTTSSYEFYDETKKKLIKELLARCAEKTSLKDTETK